MLNTTGIRCREIQRSDFASIADLLAKGFPSRSDPDFWLQVLRCLAERAIEDFPACGYLLEQDGVAAGVVLLIFSRTRADEIDEIRCNVSSWYVEPAYRPFASLFINRALRSPGVTYTNVSPAPHTAAMLKTQGYELYCSGQVVAFPSLSRRGSSGHVVPVTASLRSGPDLPEIELNLLQDHVSFGCISLICIINERRFPFVFRKMHRYGIYGIIPYAHLLYCRSLDDLSCCIGMLGRFLLRYGLLLAVIDADSPMPGVVGRYIRRWPKYFKGPHRPRLGDLAYTEMALFGL